MFLGDFSLCCLMLCDPGVDNDGEGNVKRSFMIFLMTSVVLI